MPETIQIGDRTVKLFKIPLKAGGTIAVNADEISAFADEIFDEILAQGLKSLLNRGMDKAVGPVKGLEGDKALEAKTKAEEKAQANLAELKAGTVKKTAAKATKTSGAVNTEAMRLARILVKDALKHAGEKVSYYPASTITESAKSLLVADPSILEKAKANIEAHEAAKSATNDKLAQIVAATKPSDKLIAKAKVDAEKKKANKPLSAKQAGKVAPHKPTKGQSAPATH